MKSLASPGPDRLSTYFYQYYWDIMGNNVITNSLNILNKYDNVSNLNKNLYLHYS